MNRLNWDGLRYFLAAAEAGSLTAAASELGSNQPTVGRHIDTLETELGSKLFQRSVKGLTLTAEGHELLTHCREIEAHILSIERTVSGERTIRGTVRLALPEGLSLEVFAPCLPDFYDAYPEIQLLLNVSSNTTDLTRGEADIAVRLFRPREANLVVKHIGTMAMGLYATSAYLDRYGHPKKPVDLTEHRIITYGDQLSSLPENRKLLHHAKGAVQALSSDSTSSRLRATLAGVGISIQPTIFTHNNPQLVQVLATVELPAHEMWLVYHKDLRQIPRIRAVLNFISTTMQKFEICNM